MHTQTIEQDLSIARTELSSGIHGIVEQLSAIRNQSLIQRDRAHRPPKLPSKTAIARVIEGLTAALFPNRLGAMDVAAENIDAYVAITLDQCLSELNRQLRKEIAFSATEQQPVDAITQKALQITHEFAAALPAIRQLLDTDIEAAYEGDPAAKSLDEVIVCYPGITAMIHHRLAHALYRSGAPLTSRIIAELAHGLTGIDIHPGASIGRRFFIDHGTGVVIGQTAIIGNNVRIYQAVTLGAKRFPKNSDGSLVKDNLRHPIVEDDVVIYAGATILGRVTIGKEATIGGNVWVTRDIPAGTVVTQ
ncbi:serine O-acetyltransferase EpsC [Methylophaga lonarensis]|uniref:serine O-acetyltransferase EpsC n=1 Tax=Methylophaga lonarensis TaxID=999151 RepID=UPI003D27CE4D